MCNVYCKFSVEYFKIFIFVILCQDIIINKDKLTYFYS